MSKAIVLFLDSSPTLPKSNLAYQLKFKCIGSLYSGYIVSCVSNSAEVGVTELGPFKYFPFVFHYGNALVRNFLLLKNLFFHSLNIFFSNKYEKYQIIVSPNPLITGLVAVLLGKITRSKVIIEVNGNFESALKLDSKDTNSFLTKAKEKIAFLLISYVLKEASIVRLLYKKQLETLSINNKSKLNTVYFPNFVPINQFVIAPKKDEKYILALGYPFYLKGFDVLIKAFVKISNNFPEYKLKIVGYCPEGIEYYENLAEGNKNVEINQPVQYDSVIKLMTNCSLFILPSRTEAMGRVLLEAMASQKPVIASNVGGIPAVVNDKFNGLLFETENVDDLAEKMTLLMSDRDYALKLAENGYNYVLKNHSEKGYLKNIDKMIQSIIDKN